MVLDFIARNHWMGSGDHWKGNRSHLQQYIISLDGERCANPWLLTSDLVEINNVVGVILIVSVAIERAQVVFSYCANIDKSNHWVTDARLGVSS